MFASTKFTPTPRKLQREKTTLSTNSDSDKEPVHVYCRLRPLKSSDSDQPSMKLLSPNEISVVTEAKGIRKEMCYKFKHIFTAYSTQKEVFEHLAYPLLEDLLKGRNGLLFSYGVTGSGKTYTLTGNQENPGIMPRCINTIFNSIGELQAPKFIIKSDRMNGFEVQTEDDALHDRLSEIRNLARTPKNQKKMNDDKTVFSNEGSRIALINDNSLFAIFITYIEIYNNNVYDLLDESGNGKSLQNKILREDSQRNMYVNGVTEVEVKSAQEAFELFSAGQKKKKMAHTTLNAESSRSHSIFTIRVAQLEQVTLNEDGKPIIPEKNLLTVSQLSLVDLAGSERTSRTQNTGDRLREASCINNSLMSLRTCMEILRENQRTRANKVVPYRDSRLTYLFKNYFEGDGTVQMIVCVNPSYNDLDENLHVLKFAEISQDVKITKFKPQQTPLSIKKTIKKRATPVKIKTKALFSVLPEIPFIKFDFSNVEECGLQIDKVIKSLEFCKPKISELVAEIDKTDQSFRKRLVDMENDNVQKTLQANSYDHQLQKQKQKNNNLVTKITHLESSCGSLEAKNKELEGVICSLHNMIDEKDLKLNQKILDKEKQKQKSALANERKNQELESKLRKQREHFHANMRAKEIKLRMVKEALDAEIVVSPMEEQVENIPPPTPKTPESSRRNLTTQTHSARRRRSRSTDGGAGTLKDPVLGMVVQVEQIVFSRGYPHPLYDGLEEKLIDNILPIVDVNILKYSDKSRVMSCMLTEVWLEHNAIKPVPLGTVMQPTMKKRKSVSKLTKATDVTNSKQTKYCLVAQEQDADGEVETKLYKGDIVPTCGGGAQVIFNDVERLRQESPTRDD